MSRESWGRAAGQKGPSYRKVLTDQRNDLAEENKTLCRLLERVVRWEHPGVDLEMGEVAEVPHDLIEEIRAALAAHKGE